MNLRGMLSIMWWNTSERLSLVIFFLANVLPGGPGLAQERQYCQQRIPQQEMEDKQFRALNRLTHEPKPIKTNLT